MLHSPTHAADESPFNYALLEPNDADKARAIAARVRKRIHQGIGVIVDIGQDLIEAKDHLSHGQFGKWIQLEFGWTRRTASNFMSVAAQFGPKREMISHLKIATTAAYLLAAPSTPPEARDEAILLAQKGTRITPGIVREIVSKHRHTIKRAKRKTIEKDRLAVQLKIVLRRIRNRWDPLELDSFADHLTEFLRNLKKGRGPRVTGA